MTEKIQAIGPKFLMDLPIPLANLEVYFGMQRGQLDHWTNLLDLVEIGDSISLEIEDSEELTLDEPSN